MPAFGLANTITGFATLFSGCMCLMLSWLMHPQPRRWHFVYWMIVLTGVLTVTLHGFGETLGGPGPRWLWSFLDTGSNIMVAWALALAVLGDYYPRDTQRWARATLTVAMLVGVAWHFYDRLPSTGRSYLISFGKWGGFYPGESWLIAMSFVGVGLLYARRTQIPSQARPLLNATVAIFFCGMLLATAKQDIVAYPFFAWHAIWHLVGACGFVTLWAFNHVRFSTESSAP